MDDTTGYEAIPTLTSLWSAMLGGAIGAAAGKLSATVLCNAPIGFVIGASASVLLHVILNSLVYVIARGVFQAEFDEYAIAGYKSDSLASVLGGIAGGCGAVIVTLALPANSLRDPHAFAVCWSTVTFVALLLTLVLLWRSRWK